MPIRYKSKALIVIMYLWLAAIWIVSSLPGDSLPEIDQLGYDKIWHVISYAVLTSLFFVNYKSGYFDNMCIKEILMLLVIVASLDEAHQYLISNREVAIFDLAANIFGIVIGHGLGIIVYDKIGKRKSNNQ